MPAASLYSSSTSLLSVPTPPTDHFSLPSKFTTLRALNPRAKKPPGLSCAAASPTTSAPAAKAKAGSWRELCSLNSWIVRDYRRLVDSVGAFEPALLRLSDEQVAFPRIMVPLFLGSADLGFLCAAEGEDGRVPRPPGTRGHARRRPGRYGC
jgi:hypothetical protein